MTMRLYSIRCHGGFLIAWSALASLASSSAYDLGKKIHWVPRPIRRCIGKIFVAAKYVQKKVLSGKINNAGKEWLKNIIR